MSISLVLALIPPAIVVSNKEICFMEEIYECNPNPSPKDVLLYVELDIYSIFRWDNKKYSLSI